MTAREQLVLVARPSPAKAIATEAIAGSLVTDAPVLVEFADPRCVLSTARNPKWPDLPPKNSAFNGVETTNACAAVATT